MPTPISSAEVENLLRLSVHTARAGNHQQARAVFRALSRQVPRHPHVWLCLARYAETEQEERQALEHFLKLRPDHPMARQRLQRLAGTTSPPSPAIATRTPPAAYPPPTPPTPHTPDFYNIAPPQRGRGLFLATAGVLLLVVLLVMVGISTGVLSPGNFFANAPEHPAESRAERVGAGNAAATATLTPPPTPTTPPRPTPTVLPMGYPLESANWTVTLFQTAYTHVLTAGVGTFEPEGKLLLILAAVGNNEAEPRHIPPELLRVTDAQGRSYTPAPDISSAYLRLHGRGSYGNLAYEEEIPPGGHLYNIPLFFDVPPDATDLVLTIVEAPTSGWHIAE